jgi:8-amino-7-oxononanoate synthase
MTTQPKPGLAGAGYPDTQRGTKPPAVSAGSQPHGARPAADEPLAAPAGCAFERLPPYTQLKQQLAELAKLGIANPYFRSHDGVSSNIVTVEGREYINYSGYNYLGLAGHPEVSAAALAAIDRYGTSVSASRFASGEIPLHGELERELAAMLGTDDCLAFVSGYGTNITTIGHLFDGRDLIIHDELIHNSARLGGVLSGARRFVFPHNDFEVLDKLLTEHRPRCRRALIIVEGAYSMDGDVPDLPRIVALKRRHDALLMVDEAHSIGVLGKHGRGIGEHFGLSPTDVDIWMGTLSKTFASSGGYIAGSTALVETLRYTAPGFVYSVGLSPADTAAALAAVRLMQREPDRVTRLRSRIALFLTLAREAGLDTGASESAVVPVILGDSILSLALADALFARGINVHPILHPAVPEASARLRFFITETHTDAQIRSTVAHIVEALASLGQSCESVLFPSGAAAR